MSHQEKERIFDEYARIVAKNTYLKIDDWKDLLYAFQYRRISLYDFMNAIFAACDLVQEEQQKRIAENVNSETIQTTFGPFECYDKDSIINTENLIK